MNAPLDQRIRDTATYMQNTEICTGISVTVSFTGQTANYILQFEHESHPCGV